MPQSSPSASARKIARSAALRFALLLGLALIPGPALACDCVSLIPGNPRFQADIDRIAEYYPVAAEGVLKADGAYAWRFTPTHEYRGPRHAAYRIQLLSDCSLDPLELKTLIGKPVFLLLAEGEGQNRGTYEIGRCVNRQSPEVEQAIRARMGAGCRPR
ncbi:hypothetical protein [Sphingomonas sp. URHD0057]|uniref:hypothetical protein n=1 Tax=Sphingomonas sp. URHD0057 TaxID=1380389 RepID=UPI0012DD0635|nr:hypothetical protein [Sphingomonas sp. URHD0057]